MQDIIAILNSIPPNETDKLLISRGYNLTAEYFEILSHASLNNQEPVLELATGTGRMSAVLSRLGYDVITGDVSMEDRKLAESRIGKEYLHKVKFKTLDMKQLPFDNNSFTSIVTMNTFHHLDDPEICLQEIIRVHSGTNSLVIGDFNDKGFDELDNAHRTIYGKNHTCGNFDIHKLKPLLGKYYQDIKEIHTTLNFSLIATNKK
jgi:ubiquinone/menaquinone biosynthesis C-methylase UbiE